MMCSITAPMRPRAATRRTEYGSAERRAADRANWHGSPPGPLDLSQPLPQMLLSIPASAFPMLSLNASFMFIGFSSGAALGSLTVAHSSVANLGWVGATCEVAAALFLG